MVWCGLIRDTLILLGIGSAPESSHIQNAIEVWVDERLLSRCWAGAAVGVGVDHLVDDSEVVAEEPSRTILVVVAVADADEAKERR